MREKARKKEMEEVSIEHVAYLVNFPCLVVRSQ